MLDDHLTETQTHILIHLLYFSIVVLFVMSPGIIWTFYYGVLACIRNVSQSNATQRTHLDSLFYTTIGIMAGLILQLLLEFVIGGSAIIQVINVLFTLGYYALGGITLFNWVGYWNQQPSRMPLHK